MTSGRSSPSAYRGGPAVHRLLLAEGVSPISSAASKRRGRRRDRGRRPHRQPASISASTEVAQARRRIGTARRRCSAPIAHALGW